MRAALAIAVLGASCADFDWLEAHKPRRITVRAVDRFYFDGGVTEVPAPTADKVLVSVLTDDGWESIFGDWVDAGVAVVRSVPRGYTLVTRLDIVAGVALDRDATEIDLGLDNFGQAHPLAVSSSTFVTFDAFNSLLVDNKTLVRVRLPGYETWVDNVINHVPFTVFPPVTQPGLPLFVYNARWNGAPLIVDEPVQLFQYSSQTLAGGATAWTVAKTGTVRATAVEGERRLTGMVALTDMDAGVVPGTAVSYDFEAQTTAMVAAVPNAVPRGGRFATLLSTHGAATAFPVQEIYVPDGGRVAAPALAVNPLPDEPWEALHELTTYVDTPLNLGATETFPLFVEASYSGPANTNSWWLTSQFSVVRDVKVVLRDGRMLSEGQLEDLTPEVVWTRPVIGSPNRYRVAVVLVDIDSNNAVKLAIVDRYIVTEERLKLPPLSLGSSKRYFFLVVAENCGVPEASAPLRFRNAPTCARSSNRSRVFTTPMQ